MLSIVAKEESESIRERYARRAARGAHHRYNPILPPNVEMRRELDNAMCVLLRKWLGKRKLADQRILEIGCGAGHRLLTMIALGANPRNIVGIDLIPERIAVAQARLPASIKLIAGDAVGDALDGSQFDLILQYTVFSSILDDNVLEALAQKMWSKLADGGAVLSYDFAFRNPYNADVRAIPVEKLRKLFPSGKFMVRLLTVAPPLARILPRQLYSIAQCVPPILTHRLCLIEKH